LIFIAKISSYNLSLSIFTALGLILARKEDPLSFVGRCASYFPVFEDFLPDAILLILASLYLAL